MDKLVSTAVILAAGRGTRLQPYTYEIPKGFIEVGTEKLIERSIRILKENGMKRIIIGTGHLHGHYERLAAKEGLTTFLNPEYSSTGSFQTLIHGADLITENFLLLESDLLYHSDAIKQLLLTNEKDVVLTSGFTHSNDEVYVEVQNDKLVNLSKNKEVLSSADAELVGIWKLSLDLLKKLKTYHGEAKESSQLDYEVAIARLSNQHPVDVLKIEHLAWCEIDNEEHLLRAKERILPHLD